MKAKNLPLEKCQLTSAKFLSRFYSQTAFYLLILQLFIGVFVNKSIIVVLITIIIFSMSFFGMVQSKLDFHLIWFQAEILKGPLGFGKIQGATKWRLEINMHDLFTFSPPLFYFTNFTYFQLLCSGFHGKFVTHFFRFNAIVLLDWLSQVVIIMQFYLGDICRPFFKGHFYDTNLIENRLKNLLFEECAKKCRKTL